MLCKTCLLAAAWGLAFLAGSAVAQDALPEPEPLQELAAPAPITILSRGRASWYGAKFHGKRTSSGEAFDMNALTAAHPTLPFGTKLRVRNQANGREVVVRINDRGPHVRGRIIDLSKAAASALGFVRAGEARVVLMAH
jgi:rare lipoprotein A